MMDSKGDGVALFEFGAPAQTQTQRANYAPYTAAASGNPGPNYAIPETLLAVFDAFAREGIAYCYWKSSRRFQAVMSGEGDVDLLIAVSHQHHAEAVLLKNDFKKFPSVPHRDHPSISSFLGFDEATDRLIHLHVHYRLMIGERLFKTYRIPWEERVLARARFHPSAPVRILDPSSEALLLLVRCCLELQWTDPVTVVHWRSTVTKFAADRDHVAELVKADTLRSLADEWLGRDVAEPVIDWILGKASFNSARRLRPAIKKHFAPWRTCNAAEARLHGLWRAIGWAAGAANQRALHLPRPWNRRCPGGGKIVALLGVDGSGKSTAVAGLRLWLGSEIDVLPVYFGTGDGRPSLLLLPLKLMVPIATAFVKRKPRGASHGDVTDRPAGAAYSALLMLWAMILAIEKRSKLTSAQRGAQRGLLVIADRYPQDQIADYNDGPLLQRLPRAPRWMRRFETRSYARARLVEPDLVLKLIVSPSTLACREPDMAGPVIRSRVDSVKQLEFPGSRVVCIDAEQSLPLVTGIIKHEVWRLL